MRRVVKLVVAVSLVLGAAPLYAAKDNQGASATAYERASDEAIFHRVGDWFATIGKSKEDKQAVIAEHRAKRMAKQAQKELEKQAKTAQRGVEQAAKDLKKAFGQ